MTAGHCFSSVRALAINCVALLPVGMLGPIIRLVAIVSSGLGRLLRHEGQAIIPPCVADLCSCMTHVEHVSGLNAQMHKDDRECRLHQQLPVAWPSAWHCDCADHRSSLPL